MKRAILSAILLSLLVFSLSAAPYLGISQGLGSTSVEVGYLTRSIDQNLSLSLPTLDALDRGDDFYRYPVLSLNILYKLRLGSTIAFAVGPSLRMGWEYEKALILQGGFVAQISLEAPEVMDILFVEGGYLPKAWQWLGGTPSSGVLEKGISQFLRFGYRHAF
ncbi:hypothetical protein [Sphaerochaeta sp. PS]|uniref:hypothetical protein n=1 Tax=Sphaerochaeta sp. PS TaxID=3076336 RepID=UPI0028A3E1E7|nr:hypothetical protein [Sphaerochaeta sp. PS]MDT4763118.1 hypothetical protein [Sphaerochaeta sp. PS]